MPAENKTAKSPGRAARGVIALPYEELAKLYRKQNDSDKENWILERLFSQKPAPGVNTVFLRKRLQELREE